MSRMPSPKGAILSCLAVLAVVAGAFICSDRGIDDAHKAVLRSAVNRLANSRPSPAAAASAALANRPLADEPSEVAAGKPGGESGGEARSAGLFALTERLRGGDLAAAGRLAELAAAPIPGGDERRFELGLRVRAVEAIDKAAVAHPELASLIAKIADGAAESSVRFLTQISLQGLAEGRPGKLTRFIDLALAEKAGAR